MSLLQVLLYFLREASTSLLRSWKVSLLAVVTIGVSLFVSGLFLMAGRNLSSVVEVWRAETKTILYFEPGVPVERRRAVTEELLRAPWVLEVEEISAQAARERFQRLFPTLGDLVEGWGEEPLPTSLEIRFDPARSDPRTFDRWLSDLRALPDVQMVDDDREWLEQLATLVSLARGLGLGLGGVLLGAAIFTIASVVKLTAYLYRREIEVMRLVGATEFVIRGPFYVEGLLQGIGGALLALAGLGLAYAGLAAGSEDSLLRSLLALRFLPWQQCFLLVLVGALAGFVGAVVSLRAEVAGQRL